MLARIFRFVAAQGAIPGMQLAHAGRKASTAPPWQGGDTVPENEGGWSPTFAPSPLPFQPGDQTPQALDLAGIERVRDAFVQTARRAHTAGARVLELHAAHGYLLHSFLSPLSNQRTDRYGGSFENRIRFLCETTNAVRRVWPDDLPLFVRISSTDWAEGGWTDDDSVALARELKTRGVDLIDCSSGGTVPHAQIPTGAGYQVPFAARLRRETGIATGAVGLITEPAQADQIIRSGQADLVIMAREFLREPYWPLNAAAPLHQKFPPPVQYARAFS